MQINKAKIENIITSSGLLTLKAIKEELKISENSSLICLLMEYLKSEIEKINGGTTYNDFKKWVKISNYIKPENNDELKLFENLAIEIIELLSKKEAIFFPKNVVRESIINFKNYLETFVFTTKMSLVAKKETSFPDISETKLKRIILDLIFKWHNYRYVAIILKHYPTLCNIKVNNETIIIKLLKEYLKYKKKRSYLSRIIYLFIYSQKIKLEEWEKDKIIAICKNVNNYNLESNELLFIKELLYALKTKKDLTLEEKIELLKKRYGFIMPMVEEVIQYFPQNVIDLTDRKIITIDSNGTQVFDDAISFQINSNGTFELGIYLADLTAIETGSFYDKYALNQFETIYAERKAMQMLPDEILQKFSLNKGRHYAMAFIFTFNSRYELIKCQINKALINVSNNFSHVDIAESLANSDSDTYLMIKCLLELSEAITDTFASIDKYHDIKVFTNKLFDSFSEVKCGYTPGNRIITANMIFLNHYLAQFFYEYKLPFIYSNNEIDSQKTIRSLLRKFKHDENVESLLKAMTSTYKPSTFSSVNKGHQGLGLNAYAKITNPTRQYVSMFLQRLIHELFVLKMPIEEYLKKYEDIEGYAKQFNLLQKRNNEYIADYICLKKNT